MSKWRHCKFHLRDYDERYQEQATSFLSVKKSIPQPNRLYIFSIFCSQFQQFNSVFLILFPQISQNHPSHFCLYRLIIEHPRTFLLRRGMSDHQVVSVDRLIASDTLKLVGGTEVSEYSSDGHGHVAESSYSVEHKDLGQGGLSDEEQPLIQAIECRICQEEDNIKNLEVPCACSGSLKYAHRKCVQKWCNEKGDIICEICHQPYHPGYTAPPPRAEDTTIDISTEWTVSGAQLDLNDPRLLAMAAAERRLLEAEYDEYSDTNANGAAFCRSAVLILMALLLLRHALYVTNPDGDDDDDISTFFSLFLLRAAGFLLPCYIMAWAISILQRRRQRQEAAALAASEVAYVIQAGQNGGLHFAIAPGPAVAAHHPEPLQ